MITYFDLWVIVSVESDIIRLPVELGNEKISYNKDIVLLLGDTGVGKSTLLYYITGAEFEVKNAKISGERTSILQSNGHFIKSKITHNTPAKTKFPNFYEHEGIIYLDCPGLGDNNRYEKDKLFELSENAKVVLLLSEENLSDKGEKFISLLSKLKHLLGNFDDVKDALSFVITKASLGYDIQNFRAWINNTVIPQQNYTGFTTEFHKKMLSHLSSEDSRIGLFLKHDESSFMNDIIKLNLRIIKENINASTAARGLKVQFELSNESKLIGKELVKHIETYLSQRSDDSINIILNTINTPKGQQAHKELKIIEILKKYPIFCEQIIKNQQALDILKISASDTGFCDNVALHTISQNTPKDQQAHKELKIIEILKKYLIFREQIIKNQQALDILRISASDTGFCDNVALHTISQNTPKDQQTHKKLKIIEDLKKYLIFREQITKNQQALDILRISASDTGFCDNVALHTISQNTPKGQQAHKELKIIEILKKYLIFREQIIKNQQALDILRIFASDTGFCDKIEHLSHDPDIIYKKNVASQRQKSPQLDKDYDNRSQKATALIKYYMLTLFQIEECESLLKCYDQKLQKELLQHPNNATQTILYTLQSSATNIFDKKKKEAFISAQNNKEIAISHAASINTDDATNQPPRSDSSLNDTTKPPNNWLQLFNFKTLRSEAFKALLSSKDVKSDNAIDILKDHGALKRFAPRQAHPDKENGQNDDSVFVKSLEEKFKDDIQVKEIAQRLPHWITTGSKTVDTAVDFARFIYIPTRDNMKKALISSIKLYGTYSSAKCFTAINALDALDVAQHLYTGEYFKAAKSAIMAASFTAIPYIIGLLNMPYIPYANLILTTYHAYSAISNMYSLYLEANSEEGAKKSANAYSDLYAYYSSFQNFYFNFGTKLTSILDFGVHDESVKEVIVQEATSSVEII